MRITVGIELNGTRASTLGRVDYLFEKLKSSDLKVKEVCAGEYVDIRIVQSGRFEHVKNEKILLADFSNPILIPPRYNGLVKNIYQRFFINRKWRNFLCSCDAIVVACNEQKKSIQVHNRNVYVIPDVSYYHREYLPKRPKSVADAVTFVWDGQGHNFPYVHQILKNNIKFFRRPDVLVRVITDRFDKVSGEDNEKKLVKLDINYEFFEWAPESYISLVATSDIGLAPVDMKCLHAKAKPENKIVNYGGLGLPTIASETDAYLAVSKGFNGLVTVCRNENGWTEALNYWLNEKQNLYVHSEQLHQFVKKEYKDDALTGAWFRILQAFESRLC